MSSATQRKGEMITKTVEKAAGSRNTIEKDPQEAEKISAMQKRLEDKLFSALERKEKIITERARKAGGKSNLSAERGQSVREQKELTVERIKTENQEKLLSAKKRGKLLQELEKEKKEIHMMRRVMVLAAEDGGCSSSVSSLQDKLEMKLQTANERKKKYLAEKVSKAAMRGSSASEFDTLRQQETLDQKLKTEMKLESAAQRKALLAKKYEEKMELRRKRREQALEFSRQKKAEQETIAKGETRSAAVSVEKLPVVEEVTDDDSDDGENETFVESEEEVTDDNSDDGENETFVESEEIVDLNENEEYYEDFDQIVRNESKETYNDKKLAAREQLIEEIRRANDAKTRELRKITDERREEERREMARLDIERQASASRLREREASIGTMGSIDSTDLCSSDEEDISISGLSTVKEEENKIDRRKAQAALALAELDIKLSEIQIMQAILLAEEASLSGKSEFKTSEKSVSDLNNVRVAVNISKDENGAKKVRAQAQNFFNHTLKSAKVAKDRAATTIRQMRRRKAAFRKN